MNNLSYSLKRLIRGLLSSRSGARQGFSLALVLILSKLNNCITTIDFQQQVDSYLKITVKSNRQEKKDYYFARLFYILILCRSKRLLDVNKDELLNYLIEILIQMNSKPLIKELCASVIVNMIQVSNLELYQSVLYPYLIKVKEQSAEQQQQQDDDNKKIVNIYG